MSRPNDLFLAGASLVPGALYVGKHEGDMLHMVDVMLRLSRGEVPHTDFMTPIGIMSFVPILLFINAGFGIGTAMILGQVLVAGLALPALWWVARSRFSGGWAYGFGAAVLVLFLGLVHGTAEPSVSMSMHYNRWAWAATFMVLATALLPPQDRAHPLADGLVIGLGLSLMALTKATFFVGVALPVAIALLARGALRSLGIAVLTGLAVVLLLTGLMGINFWLAWIGDLRNVASSSVRVQPGLKLSQMFGAPSQIAGSLVLILSIILLRQGDRKPEGLVLLLLAPGFVYVTWQNWGNDPKWLMLLGFLMFALMPPRKLRNALGWNVTAGIGFAGMAALTLAAPSFLNMGWSPFRHLTVDSSEYVPLLPGLGVHEDIKVVRRRNLNVGVSVPLGVPGALEEEDQRISVNGDTLPICALGLGMGHWEVSIAAQLKDSALVTGKQIFTADVLNQSWIHGAGEPLEGGAPWYYGGLSGFANADLVLVPLCPITPRVRKLILSEIEDTGVKLTEVDRTNLYILYRK